MASGIFLISELDGSLRERIHGIQERHDPKLARLLPPHVTITGSSGVGPISGDVSVERLREALEPVVETTAPIVARPGPPVRFMQSNTVVLPLDPHGPLRTLHERIARSGLPFAQARFFFTPHVTLSLHTTLSAEQVRELLAVRVEEPIIIDRIQAYASEEPMPPRRLLEMELTGEPSYGQPGPKL